MENIEIGAALGRLRKRGGKTLKQAGEAVGVGYKTVIGYENGHHELGIGRARKLLREYGFDLSDLEAEISRREKPPEDSQAALERLLQTDPTKELEEEVRQRVRTEPAWAAMAERLGVLEEEVEAMKKRPVDRKTANGDEE